MPQGLMKSLHIVEEEVFGQAITSLRDRLVVMEIDFLVLDRPPETLNKNIVEYPTTTVHVNPDSLLFQPPGKLKAGKLTTLIGIEEFGFR